jgi:hypothetical protein
MNNTTEYRFEVFVSNPGFDDFVPAAAYLIA